MNEASLSVKIEKMFAGKDHVGTVKHLEGIDIIHLEILFIT